MWGKVSTQRTVGALNLLPGVVVEAVAFKRVGDRHMDILGMEGYGLPAGRRD